MSVRSPKEGRPVKLLTASLAFFCLTVAVAPASAQLYDNGPINGTTDAWTINFGYIVSDSITCCKGGPGGGGGPAGSGTITGFEFGVWEYGGDVMTSVDWSITAGENSGTVFGSGTASGKN